VDSGKTKELEKWYKGSVSYWDRQEASVNGVLGSLPETHMPDINGSEKLIARIKDLRNPPTFGRAIDCGCGIGRITKDLLCRYFSKIDLLDPCEKYIDMCKDYVDQPEIVEHTFCKGLQQFKFEQGKYDVIWVQWCLLYMTDYDIVNFLKRAKRNLNPNGIIVVKENVLGHPGNDFDFDRDDNSVTRSVEIYRNLLTKTGLDIVIDQQQKDWPDYLFPLHMFVLQVPQKLKVER
jgi:protein N-terminal methyltransferase